MTDTVHPLSVSDPRNPAGKEETRTARTFTPCVRNFFRIGLRVGLERCLIPASQ